jgi:hypothetical protein
MNGNSNLETVTVTVPGGRGGEVVEFAASLFKPRSEPASRDALRRNTSRAYLGGESNAWRPFLRYLADHPDEWVAWPDACAAIDRTRKQASGMLGAAHRRLAKLAFVPYEKRNVGDDTDFKMSREVAEIIKSLDESEVTR